MSETSHLVVTVHGIRTYGNWQDDLKELLEEAEPGVTVLRYRYGFFSSLAFLVPPARYIMARRFRRFMIHAVESVPEGTRIDLVAHSFGTYLAASSLAHIPPNRKINTVIFAGSVLRPSFPWYRYLQDRTLGRVINECGWDDTVLVLCQATALLMGMAGRIGFQGMISDRFVNRYYRFGHGGYFDREKHFMRQNWVPLLTTEAPIPPHDERPRLTAVGGAKLFLMNNMQFIKVAGALLLATLLIWMPLSWMNNRKFKQDFQRAYHIGLLLNSQQIPLNKPSHVLELLKIDAKALNHEEGVDYLAKSQMNADLNVDDDKNTEDAPNWYERLPLLFDRAREARRARWEHARANQLRVRRMGLGDTNSARSQGRFEEAIRAYENIKDYESISGSYALCLMDYGKLLYEMGNYSKAVEQFAKIRNQVFPISEPAKYQEMPKSLLVDTFIYESDAHKMLKDWERADKSLKEAVEAANESKDAGLIAEAHNRRAWFYMDRLEVDKADSDFNAAEEAAARIDPDREFDQTWLIFWIRHGKAMAKRFKGEPEKAYDQYQQIVSELRKVMSTNTSFDPKQRQDLSERLRNSMQRRADVLFFARPMLTRMPREEVEKVFDRIQRDYQDAIDFSGNAEPALTVQLLYQKVIAQFLAELELPADSPPTHGDPAVRRELIELDFATAERIYNGLFADLKKDVELYQKVAAACMELRSNRVEPPKGSSIRFDPQAVAKFREYVVAKSLRCEEMRRDLVEMLLVSFEILLHPLVEDNQEQLTADATRMMSVLDTKTKVASHPEVRPFFDRFQRIAYARASQKSIASGQELPVPGEATSTGLENVVFFLRLPGGLAVKIVSDPTSQREERALRVVEHEKLEPGAGARAPRRSGP